MQFTVENYFFIDQVKGEGPCHKKYVEFPLIFSKIPWVISEFLEFPFKKWRRSQIFKDKLSQAKEQAKERRNIRLGRRVRGWQR